jgi:hypothetical protein
MTRWLRRTAVLGFLLSLVSLTPLYDLRASDDEASPPRTYTEEERVLDMSWWSVDGGGGVGSNGDLAVVDVVGQPESGFSIEGTRVLEAGLWAGANAGEIFSDGFESGDTSLW